MLNGVNRRRPSSTVVRPRHCAGFPGARLPRNDYPEDPLRVAFAAVPGGGARRRADPACADCGNAAGAAKISRADHARPQESRPRQKRSGPKGGYRLSRPPAEISFGQIVRSMEGPIALVSCASVNFYAPCGDCHDEASCAIRRAFTILRDQSTAVLDSISLAESAGWEKRLDLPHTNQSTAFDSDAPRSGGQPSRRNPAFAGGPFHSRN